MAYLQTHKYGNFIGGYIKLGFGYGYDLFVGEFTNQSEAFH